MTFPLYSPELPNKADTRHTNCQPPHLNCLELDWLLAAEDVHTGEVFLNMNVRLAVTSAHWLLHHTQTFGELAALLVQIQQLCTTYSDRTTNTSLPLQVTDWAVCSGTHTRPSAAPA